ncbi:MAG: nitronate monooxygenase [Chitinophagaceae bacterium]|nr:MAG: nitronate monooxygenase [Chitinophagaceae bacterium]
MWNQTSVTEKLGIEYPVLQGPFGGGLSSVALAAAVSEAGGLGAYGAYMLSPAEIHAIGRDIRQATAKPYNLNLWVSDTDTPEGMISDARYEAAAGIFRPYFDELGIPLPPKPAPFASRFENQLQAVLDVRPKVFSFMFGTLPPDVLETCRRHGIVTIGAATTLDEALAQEATGVDFILASGFEAGGHRPSFLGSAESSLTGTFVLVQLIREKVSTPVIAAGGIANGRGVAAALTLGASAVQVGTAFLACAESGALPEHREVLFSRDAYHTSLTRAFTGRLGRGVSSRISAETSGHEAAFLPFPLQTNFMAPLWQAALEQQQWKLIQFWCGQIAPVLRHRKAAALMQSLIEETNALMR